MGSNPACGGNADCGHRRRRVHKPAGHRHRFLGQRLRRRPGNNRVQKFNSSGGFLTKWGSLGTGNGQFTAPQGIATDSSGNVYVADTGNNRIQKFDSSGTFVTAWGSLGIGNGQFSSPSGVATDSLGNVYVADAGNTRIQKFTSGGAFIAKWGSVGSGNGQFGAGTTLDVAIGFAAT